MKRDMDLMRYIMLYLEENMNASKFYSSDDIDFSKFSKDIDNNIINEHLMLLLKNDFIDAVYAGSEVEPITFMIKRITNEGHDFLDSLRDDEIWNKVKEATINAGGFTLSFMVELGKEYVKERLGIK